MLSDRNAGAVFDPLDQKKVDCFFFLSWLLIYYSASYGKQIKVERIRSRWKMFLVSFYTAVQSRLSSALSTLVVDQYSHTFQVNSRFLLFRRENLKWRIRASNRKFKSLAAINRQDLIRWYIDSSRIPIRTCISLSSCQNGC